MVENTKENNLERAMRIPIGHFATIRKAMRKAERDFKAKTKRPSRLRRHIING